MDRFYFAKEVQLNPCIEDIIVDETKQLDFKQKPLESLKEINDFVKTVTKGNIPELLSRGDVSTDTKIVLANAAYFKGSWASKFDVKDTKREIFYSKPDEMHFVEMMSMNGSFNHGETHEVCSTALKFNSLIYLFQLPMNVSAVMCLRFLMKSLRR